MTAELRTEDQWALYSTALAGPAQDYYLSEFKRIEAGRWPWLSFNWAALLCTFGWLRYRRMYAWSWAWLLVSLPVIIMFMIVFVSNADGCALALRGETAIIHKIPFAMLAVNLLAPLCANRLYLQFVTVRIEAARREHPEPEALEQHLRGAGATGGYWGAIGLMGLFVVLIVGMSGGYSDYNTRAKISEVMLAGSSYRTSLTEFFEQHKRLPASIDEIGGFSGPVGKVKRIALEKDGTIRVVAGFPPAEGRSILFVPKVDAGRITWSCRSDDMPDRCLPASCRQPR